MAGSVISHGTRSVMSRGRTVITASDRQSEAGKSSVKSSKTYISALERKLNDEKRAREQLQE